MKNHTDQELIMLEALVDRKPSFAVPPFGGDYRDPYR